MKFVALVLGLLLCVPAQAANTEKLVHRVVRLFAPELKGKDGIYASGFPVSREMIMTAGHFCAGVVEGKEKVSQTIQVTYANNNDEISRLPDGQIVRFIFNDALDLCLIKVPRHGLTSFKIANYDKVRIGQKVTIIGAPLGLIFPNITEGFVTQKVTDELPVPILNGKLLTSAPVFAGNSGGPVFNEAGEVIGVLVMAITIYEHLSLSVTADDIRLFLAE